MTRCGALGLCERFDEHLCILGLLSAARTINEEVVVRGGVSKGPAGSVRSRPASDDNQSNQKTDWMD